MGRIRTVKPELFRHELLYDLEVETGLPIRISWIGLFSICDRDGRFKWRPRAIKSEVLPYDNLDFSRVLHALLTRDLLVKYTLRTSEPGDPDTLFGWIPTFKTHQVINNKERLSILPDPNSDLCCIVTESKDLSTRAPRVTDACPTPLVLSEEEGKGKERKGRERKEGNKREFSDSLESTLPNLWEIYRINWHSKYNEDPVRNARINSQLSQLEKRVPKEEQAKLIQFYLRHTKPYYSQNMHGVGALLADCEALIAQMRTGIMANGVHPISKAMTQKEHNDRIFANQLAKIDMETAK